MPCVPFFPQSGKEIARPAQVCFVNDPGIRVWCPAMTQHTRNTQTPGGHSDSGTTTHFGFQSVATEEKATLVQGVFDSVASRYDLMNDLMSGGIHRLWKSAFINWLHPRAGMTVLDVAGGTGDIAFRILRRLRDKGREGRVIVCDLTPEMLMVGRNRAIDSGLISGLEWVCGDAESLPFPDRSVDAYTIAFGLRNVTSIDATLAEARRVLKPGGRFLCLEFSHVVLPLLRPFYDRYSFAVLPLLGQVVTGNREAYRYLVESIRCFPDQSALCRRMTVAGFCVVTYRNLSGGIAAMHSGWRP
ncbi:MAG: ubiquinone/menaquinone biosynthesis methyltransferase [Rhodospirillaceae bacterium]|nr:MAG: ubiquinone/menaquinone biosynthesis methyltransferase [Rhodospirillaceae bacterium]